MNMTHYLLNKSDNVEVKFWKEISLLAANAIILTWYKEFDAITLVSFYKKIAKKLIFENEVTKYGITKESLEKASLEHKVGLPARIGGFQFETLQYMLDCCKQFQRGIDPANPIPEHVNNQVSFEKKSMCEVEARKRAII
jgi:hypothetical protein